MANAKKCDRCGVHYDIYNYKNNSEKTNGFMTLNIDLLGKYFSHKAYDLCPKCNQEFYKWLEAVDIKETHAVTHIQVDSLSDCLECITYTDCDEYPISNECFQDAIRNSFNDHQALLKITDYAKSYEVTYNIFDVVYSVNDNVVKLCNYNDRGLTKPLRIHDILAAIECYSKSASIIMCIQ